MTDNPSIPILSSAKSIPFAFAFSASEGLISLEALEISVSPMTNLLNPPPLPDTPTKTLVLGNCFLNSSATASETGATVEDPSTSTVPVKGAVSELLVEEISPEEHAIIAKRKVIPIAIINLFDLKLFMFFLHFANNFTYIYCATNYLFHNICEKSNTYQN